MTTTYACISVGTLQEAITQDTTYTKAVSKILNTCTIVQFQKKYPYPHGGNFYFRPPTPPGIYTVGAACYSPPPPGIWLSALWEVYLSQKGCICCTMFYYAKDN